MCVVCVVVGFFFFQAEDGIRDVAVTGVQTCALPICPSYMGTLDEEHSTRGRANALRSVLSGKVPKEEFTSKRLHDVMDLCLECKACKAECPSNVDMAKLKYEFLDHYHRANGLPLRNRIFGAIESLNCVGSKLAPVSNWVANSALNRWLMELITGIDRRRPLPQFASETFEEWFRKHKSAGDGSHGEVVLFHDTFNNYNTPNVAVAATRFLERSGYRVLLAEKKCCGRPMISKGMLGQAKENAAWNVAKLAPFAEKGTPIVGLEPSCLLTLRDEYPEFIRTEAAKKVAKNSFLFEEFVTREQEEGRLTVPSNGSGKKV